jgi:hypothetical protein
VAAGDSFATFPPVSGKVDADVSGSLSIDDDIYVRGDITTS